MNPRLENIFDKMFPGDEFLTSKLHNEFLNDVGLILQQQLSLLF